MAGIGHRVATDGERMERMGIAHCGECGNLVFIILLAISNKSRPVKDFSLLLLAILALGTERSLFCGIVRRCGCLAKFLFLGNGSIAMWRQQFLLSEQQMAGGCWFGKALNWGEGDRYQFTRAKDVPALAELFWLQ